MARYYKPWDEHSARWKREQTRNGLDKKKWNAWLKLSDKTRKVTTPKAYASGKTVAEQLRERKQAEAVKRIRAANPQSVRTSVVIRNVQKMSDGDLNWTLKATPQQIRGKASQKHVQGYTTNPWWYR